MKTNVYCDRKAEIMLHATATPVNVLLFALDETLARGIITALTGQGSPPAPLAAQTRDECLNLLRKAPVDLIFCPSDPSIALPLLRFLKKEQPGVPVVVVSHEPEFGEWLDAMEAGASDYCCAPFDREQLTWIVASHVSVRHLAA